MEINLIRTRIEDAREAIVAHLESLTAPVDSFVDDHILGSTHYVIDVSANAQAWRRYITAHL